MIKFPKIFKHYKELIKKPKFADFGSDPKIDSGSVSIMSFDFHYFIVD